MHGAIGIRPQQFTNAPYVITTTPHYELGVSGPKFDLNPSTRKVDNLMSGCRDTVRLCDFDKFRPKFGRGKHFLPKIVIVFKRV